MLKIISKALIMSLRLGIKVIVLKFCLILKFCLYLKISNL